jgi:hypothetical protein
MGKRDVNQLAKFITDITIGDSSDPNEDKKKDVIGRAGGLKGGRARAEKLTSEQRSRIAANAAYKRWNKE